MPANTSPASNEQPRRQKPLDPLDAAVIAVQARKIGELRTQVGFWREKYWLATQGVFSKHEREANPYENMRTAIKRSS